LNGRYYIASNVEKKTTMGFCLGSGELKSGRRILETKNESY
jgi:hypothetical protein